MKKIAIVTGATGGLGKEFVRILCRRGVDEIWAIARNKEKLELLKEEFGDKIVILVQDISKSQGIQAVSERLEQEKPEVSYLINNAGMGRMVEFEEFTMEEAEDFLSINCKAVVQLCICSVPFMKKGSHILNISSQSSFQPCPYLNLYAATKAFVTSYSRSLNVELRKKGISVTAVCPGWVDTELLVKEWNGREIRFPGIVKAAPVVEKAVRDAERGKAMSVYSLYVKYLQLFSKLMPHKFVMNLWVAGIDNYNK